MDTDDAGVGEQAALDARLDEFFLAADAQSGTA